MSTSKPSVRFPAESGSYRAARDELLEDGIQLRRSIAVGRQLFLNRLLASVERDGKVLVNLLRFC
jgi:hypothetical protein